MSDDYAGLLLDGPGRSLSGQSLSLSLPYTHLEDTYIKMISMYELNILSHLIIFSVSDDYTELLLDGVSLSALGFSSRRRRYPPSYTPLDTHVHQNRLNVCTKYRVILFFVL